MAPRYKVTLTEEERGLLESLTRSGKTAAPKFVHARALLLCDAGPHGNPWKVADVAEALGVTSRTVEHLKERFVEEGIEAALERKPRTKPPKLSFDGAFDARLTALACSPAPAGRARWTVRLLAEKVVELKIAPKVSTMSVHRAPKKNELKPHLSKYWKIPPDSCAAFVVCMEDGLDVYHAPYDPQFPLVCMDESNKQLVGEVHAPLAPGPGRGQIIDHEYVRNGVAEIFLEVEPLSGRRHVAITEHRTRKDWAFFVKGMLDERYPQATKVRLVMDNLNTHSAASLYEAFAPEEARRLARRLEIHYTPKHGSWLNVAEIELSALNGQCLDRRIPSIELMRKEVAAWELDRNNRAATIDWRFTTEDARIKLKRIYPKF
ncbi:MAG: IS630 family transposase [Limisphaerales bacterium]